MYQYVSVYVCVKTLISFLKLSLFDFTVCGAQSFSWRAALIAYKLAAFAFLVESKTVFIEFIYLSLRQLLLSFLPKKYKKKTKSKLVNYTQSTSRWRKSRRRC